MRLQFFGDSYDIVKRSLIAWLSDFGPWSAHPMFTETVNRKDARHFARFLGADLLSVALLTPHTDRESYFSLCRRTGNLFLDPDTGVRLRPCRSAQSPRYVFGSELVSLVQARPRFLTLVFDQAFSRGSNPAPIREKLHFFASAGVRGLAYSSHAPFLLLGARASLLERARLRLLRVSSLPSKRIITLGAA